MKQKVGGGARCTCGRIRAPYRREGKVIWVCRTCDEAPQPQKNPA